MRKTLLALGIGALIAPTSLLFAAESTASADPNQSVDATHLAPEKARKLKQVVVNAMPIKQGVEELITPVLVLSGAELDDKKAGTIGQTVAGEPGVQTSSFGAGVGRPIIRGLDGPRIAVLSGGLGTMDVSSVSQDHATSVEPFLADQIEILKGPATLLYGNGAIGGVVNLVDGRIPEQLPADGLSGRAELRGESVSDGITGMGRIDVGAGNFALHADALDRDNGNYAIPGRTLDNSFVRTKTGALGGSWIGDRGFLGMAVSRYLDRYGNPAEPGDEHGAGASTLSMQQTRYELKGGLNQPLPGIDSVKVSLGHSDYQHTEFAGGAIGTQFFSRGDEGRLEAVHAELAGWKGAFGLQFGRNDLRAVGEEAFIPSTQSHSLGLFATEQREWDRFKLELGARVDRTSVDPADSAKRNFSPLSLSSGASYRLNEAWHLSANVDHAQRAPGPEELFANGPHAATATFEIGDPRLGMESVNQFELGLHYHSDRVEAKLAAYENRFHDFIYLADTGTEEDGLPVRNWSQANARFHGIEGEVKLKLAEHASGRYELRVFGDTVRATLASGGNLPRIAPARIGAGLNWTSDDWRAGIDAVRYATQDRVAEFETPTPGFTLLNAHVAYTINSGDSTSWELFADATNLTNQTARLHTSIIKDVAPLPGRGVAFGARLMF